MRSVTLALSFSLWVFLIAGMAFAAENLTSEFDYKTKTQNPQIQATEESPAAAADRVYMDLKLALERYRLLEIIAISVAAVSLLVTVLRYLTKLHHTAAQIINVGEVIFIIFGVILIVLLADNETHLTASMGILGAIAGYLFGKYQKAEQSTPAPQGGGDVKKGDGG